RFRDDFAVGTQNEPEHAVRAGVLRTHVDEHFVGADIELDDGWILCCGCGHVVLSPSYAVVFQRELVILSEGMSDPVLGRQDARKTKRRKGRKLRAHANRPWPTAK